MAGARHHTLADVAAACRSEADAEVCSALASRGDGLLAALVWLSDDLPPLAGIWSRSETHRLAAMQPRRRRSFLAGRLALKILAMRWGHVGPGELACSVETVQPDGPMPRCGPARGAPPACSLAHDPGLAVAVAADLPVGVDVELIGPRLQRLAPHFTRGAELQRAQHSPLGPAAALARIWTVKESVVKACGISLAEAFGTVELLEIGPRASQVGWQGRREEALHCELGEHLLSVFVHHG